MRIRKGLVCAAALSLSLGAAVCASEGQESGTQDLSEGLTIGVVTYNPDDGQSMAFEKYLREYIGAAFDVDFYYSDACDTEEKEQEFITELHELGVQGVIGTLQYESSMDLCEEYGMYYVYSAAAISDEKYENHKDSGYFLGTISPSAEEEENSGKEMAAWFASQDEEKTAHYLILSGGAAQDNTMHQLRAVGMLEGFAEAYGFTLEESLEELALTGETVTVETGTDVEITILPGYPVVTPLEENTQSLSEEKGITAILSVVSADYVIDGIRAAEDATGTDILVGAVDCFTDNAYDLFNGVYSGGTQELNYLTGCYGAAIAPAFVAMANAYAGYAGDFLDDGAAFRLEQSFWTASGLDEFNELYSLSVGVFENTYSAQDMMQVLKDFNPDATFADFKAFAEK